MNTTTNLIIYLGLILFLFGMYSCDDPVPDEVEDLYPQEQIPWPSLADTPWPMVRHDPQGTNRSSEVGTNSINGIEIVSSSKYFESYIVLSEEDGIIRLATINDSTQLVYFSDPEGNGWNVTIDQAYETRSTPTLIQNNRILVPGNESIYEIDLISHEVSNLYTSNGRLSNISIGLLGELCFFTEDPIQLHSLDNDGTEMWSYTPSSTGVGLKSLVHSPDGEQLFFSTWTDITCISRDGEVQWQYPLNGRGTIYIIVDNESNLYMYVKEEQRIICVTAEGELRWQSTLESLGLSEIKYMCGPTMDFKGNLYFTAKDSSGSYGMVSLNNEGSIRWFQNLRNSVDLLCDKDNKIYFGYTDWRTKYMGAISENGDLIWEFEISEVSGTLTFSPVITHSGSLVYPLQNGDREHIIRLF